jgi:hypothetical protein
MSRAVGFFILLPALLSCCGCASITPPATVLDPVPIYLAEYPVHSELLMSHDGQYFAYSFGDWNYAAIGHTWPNDALGALVVSGASELEKRQAPLDPHTGGPLLYDDPDMLIRMVANRQEVEARLAVLEKRFQDDLKTAGPDGVVSTPDHSRTYVKDQQHYSVFNDCNDLTADTLRALGYRVDGFVVGSHFHVYAGSTAPEAPPARTTADSP